MRLTSLTLHGFKSFGDRTTLEFAPGVTAIVGPNGSGKSNVIDALRWTTGGGRASEFRAGDKTDLIFHGAAGKRSVSYAEVEVELKSAQKRLVISRSLFRDGQSKLKLGGKNARFLDLDEELAGSGLGRSGLALISQGEVSQVLMADPEKLLGYVAEAAGVARLSSRRDQTQARLDTAREHLQRLEDIMRELGRQLEGLKEEARQAERASTLNRDILQRRYSLSVRRVESLEGELAGLLKEQLELKETVETGRKALAAAQEGWQESRRKLAALEEVYRTSLAEAETKRGDVRVAQERFNAVGQRYQGMGLEHERLRTDMTRLAALRPPEAPEGDLATLQQTAEGAEQNLQQQEQTLAASETSLDSLREQLQTAREEAAQQARALTAFDTQKSQLETQLQDVDHRLGNHSPADEQTGEPVEADLNREQTSLTDLQAVLETNRQQLAELQQQHAHALAEAQALGRAAVRSRHAFEARQGYAQGPKHALTSGIDGLIGSVADLIRVPKDYELAIGSALGRRTENVVVDNAETAQKVVQHLKQNGGWATLLPLDLISPRPAKLPDHLAGADGVIGLCLDLLEVEPRYRAVLQQLLGNTVLVASMDDAVALARRHKQRPRLVTLEGDLLEPYGAITGGRRQVNTGLIGLATEVDEAEAVAVQAEDEEQRCLHEIQAAQQAFKSLQDEVMTTTERLRELELALAQRREQAAAQRSLREELTRGREILLTRLTDLVPPEPADAEAATVTDLEAEFDAVQSALLKQRQDVARLRQTAAESKQALAIFRERQGAYEASLARFREEQQRLEGLTAKEAQLVADLNRLEQEQGRSRTQLAEAEAAVPSDLSEKEATFEEAKRHSDEAEAQLSQLSQTQAQGGQELERVGLALARREAALELAKEEADGFPEGLTPLDGSLRSMRAELSESEQELEAIGPVNHRAARDFQEQQVRYQELAEQSTEADAAATALAQVLTDIDRETTRRLTGALARLEQTFHEHVQTLFGAGALGGIETSFEEGRPVGLNIQLQPPGKQTRSLNLLSVGERTMGALAFLFALMGEADADEYGAGAGRGLPIAILDEVDAPLDEANIRRFRDFLQTLSAQGTQFVLITHQKATMEVADVLWGVTTERGVSRVFSISKAEHAVVG